MTTDSIQALAWEVAELREIVNDLLASSSSQTSEPPTPHTSEELDLRKQVDQLAFALDSIAYPPSVTFGSNVSLSYARGYEAGRESAAKQARYALEQVFPR